MSIKLRLIGAAMAISIAKLSNAQDGALDLSFNTSGKVVHSLGTFDDDIYAVAVQPDGKIVAAGHSYQSGHYVFALTRYNSDGSLDNSFDTDGKVSTIFSAADAKAKALAIQSDGKIVVAGLSSDGSVERFAVARYNTNGSLDNTFDSDGKVTTVVGTGWSGAHSVAIQSDGKIITTGYCSVGSNQDFALVRYNSDGSLDNTFSGDGIVTTDVATKTDVPFAIKLQGDGKIVVSGYAQNISDYDFALLRYLDNGDLDKTFDTDGIVLTKIVGSFHEYGNCLDIQSDGKIVVAGGTDNTFYDFVVARYLSNGSLDNSFDGDGISKVDYVTGTNEGEPLAIKIQSDGKIILAGHVAFGSDMNFAVLKFKSNGSADSTFDGDGLVTTAFNNNDGARAVAIQSDGKIIAAGGTYDGSQKNFGLARYKNTIVSSNISELPSNNNQFSLSPNPFSTLSNLTSKTVLKNATISIYNALGQQLYAQEHCKGQQLKIENQGWPSGLYWLLIQDENSKAAYLQFVIGQ